MRMSRLQKSYKTFVVQATAIPLREPEGSFTVHVDIRKDNREMVATAFGHSFA